MGKVVKKVVKGVSKIAGGVLGMGKVPKPPDAGKLSTVDAAKTAQDEYTRRYDELKAQRVKDLADMRARLGAAGIDPESAGWAQGLATIDASYEEKLKQLGADPYFANVLKQTGW
jgi:hypothetical protein